ncbi:MAG TPA: hypothetical protein VGM90_36915 [Kofleriaceae bacterium]
MTAAIGCSKPPPPVEPGPPIPADPPMKLRGMVEECDAMTTAIQSFQTCKNLEKDDRRDLDAWLDRAQKDFAAGRKANPEPNAQQAIALACHRATMSVQAANERCIAGPRPKDAW